MLQEDAIKRISFVMGHKKISKYRLSVLSGINAANLNKQLDGKQTITERTLSKIADAVGVNLNWLLTGEGEIWRTLAPESISNVQHVSNAILSAGNNSGSVLVQNAPDSEEAVSIHKAPVVPSAVTRLPDLDVFEYVRTKAGVELSNVIIEDVRVSLWYNVEDDALSPRFLVGDSVALMSNQKGVCKFVPGRVYAVDCKSVGLILRVLFNSDKGLLARSLCPEKFPDLLIEPDDVIRIYRVLGMFRLNN